MILFFKNQSYRFCQSAVKTAKKVNLEISDKPQDPILLNILSKHYRKFHLEQPLAEFRKVVVPAKRMRTVEDHLESLRLAKEVPTVIKARDEFQDIDLVLDLFQVNAIKRRVSANVAPIYVRLPEGEDIRCILNKAQTHATENWIIKLHLNRYIVGRPNLMFLPFQLENSFKNAFYNRGSMATSTMHGVWVYCYNETYPSVLNIDIANVTPARAYKIGDLQNSLPPGIILHERYAKLMNNNIMALSIDQQTKFVDTIRSMKIQEEKIEEVIDDDEDIDDEVAQKPKEKKVVAKTDKGEKRKIRKSAQFKKQIDTANKELKKEMETLAKENAKAEKK